MGWRPQLDQDAPFLDSSAHWRRHLHRPEDADAAAARGLHVLGVRVNLLSLSGSLQRRVQVAPLLPAQRHPKACAGVGGLEQRLLQRCFVLPRVRGPWRDCRWLEVLPLPLQLIIARLRAAAAAAAAAVAPGAAGAPGAAAALRAACRAKARAAAAAAAPAVATPGRAAAAGAAAAATILLLGSRVAGPRTAAATAAGPAAALHSVLAVGRVAPALVAQLVEADADVGALAPSSLVARAAAGAAAEAAPAALGAAPAATKAAAAPPAGAPAAAPPGPRATSALDLDLRAG
jgi:hypothetical protein